MAIKRNEVLKHAHTTMWMNLKKKLCWVKETGHDSMCMKVSRAGREREVDECLPKAGEMGGRDATLRVWGIPDAGCGCSETVRVPPARVGFTVCGLCFTSDVTKGKSPKGGVAVRNISQRSLRPGGTSQSPGGAWAAAPWLSWAVGVWQRRGRGSGWASGRQRGVSRAGRG